MKNITNIIQSSFSKKNFWSEEKFDNYLDSFVNLIEGSTKDWDDGAGENWGLIVINERPVIYLHKKTPLAFIQINLIPQIKKLIDKEQINIISFDNQDQEIFSLESNFFKQWSTGSSVSAELNHCSLSVNDIWWATVLSEDIWF